MKTGTRIYLVRDTNTDKVRLVEATNAAQAIRHVAAQAFRINVAKATDVAYHMSRDAVVERAGAELDAEAA